MPSTAAYTSTVKGRLPTNQPWKERRKPARPGRTTSPTPADTAACAAATARKAATCTSTVPLVKRRSNGYRSPSLTIGTVSAAHTYQPGASLAKARHTEIGAGPWLANITVSNVESRAGIVHSAKTSHGDAWRRASSDP